MNKHLIIVGGGIAGLTTAFYAQRLDRDLRMTIIEKDHQMGGKITTETPNGFVIEGGPDSFITQKPWGYQLCQDLGIEDQLIGTNDDRRKTYILRRGKLRKMPDGLMLVVPTRFMPFALSPLISPWGKLRMGLDLFIKPRMDDSDESLADFMRRRLGQEALEVLGEPLMGGIHVADAEKLSLKTTFPRYMDIERKYGSLTKGMIAARKNRPPASKPLFMTPKNGTGQIVEALEAQIEADIISGTAVESVMSQESGAQVTLADGRQLLGDAVVIATPAYVTAKILADVPQELTDLLNGIRYVSSATVSLGFKADEFKHPLDGFGFVIPRTEPTQLFACTWTSTKFDHRTPEDSVLLRAFVGGAHQEELVDLDDDSMIAMVRGELKKILGVSAEPRVVRVYRWHKANPQYDVGHLDRVDQIEALLPPHIYVTGSPYRGGGIPDCTHQGQQTAEAVVQALTQAENLEVIGA